MHRYIILTALQTLYAYFIEGNTVFVGKRKTFSKRVCSPFRFLFDSFSVIIFRLYQNAFTLNLWQYQPQNLPSSKKPYAPRMHLHTNLQLRTCVRRMAANLFSRKDGQRLQRHTVRFSMRRELWIRRHLSAGPENWSNHPWMVNWHDGGPRSLFFSSLIETFYFLPLKSWPLCCLMNACLQRSLDESCRPFLSLGFTQVRFTVVQKRYE